jgi:predicted dehydrogenase
MSEAAVSAPSVILVGLGRVGAQAPAARGPDGRAIVRNHLDAIQAAGGKIMALVDRLDSQRAEARRRLQNKAEVAEAEQLSQISAKDVDVMVIATPPGGRLATLEAALALRPKAVLMEKPLAPNEAEAKIVISLTAAASVPLFVAFNRRCDPGIVKFCGSIRFDQVKAALFRYGKGLVNYGSHAVDHALQWFGPAAAVQAAPSVAADPDADCVSFRCIMQSGLAVDFLGVPDVDYDMFEAELYLPDRVVGLRNNGAEKIDLECRDSLYYPGYTGLVPAQPSDAPQPIGGFVEMYRELFAAVREGRTASGLCTAQEGLDNVRVLAAAATSARQGGGVIALGDFMPSFVPRIAMGLKE